MEPCIPPEYTKPVLYNHGRYWSNMQSGIPVSVEEVSRIIFAPMRTSCQWGGGTLQTNNWEAFHYYDDW